MPWRAQRGTPQPFSIPVRWGIPRFARQDVLQPRCHAPNVAAMPQTPLPYPNAAADPNAAAVPKLPMPYTTLISADELTQAHISDPNWVIVDCRFSLKDTEYGRNAYRASHLPGSIYAHLDDDLSGPIVPGETGRHPLPDAQVFANWLGANGIDTASQVVAYDDLGGPVAARLWWMLRWLGHERVAVLNGGWQQWNTHGFPVRSETPSPTPRTFMPAPNTDLVASIEHIQHPSDSLLIDARAYERYAGINEPIDPVAGHIPGAKSFPFKENLDETGLFKSATALRERFSSVLKENPDNHLICYCGSGVTAAHNILALAHAGIQHVALYPGSWSEWILDTSRPIERI